MSIVIVVGTRSEIIKMTPLVKKLEKRGVDLVFIHTGHYYEMSRVFLEKLGLPSPSESFEMDNSNPAAQIGEMMIKFEKTLENNAGSEELDRKVVFNRVQYSLIRTH